MKTEARAQVLAWLTAIGASSVLFISGGAAIQFLVQPHGKALSAKALPEGEHHADAHGAPDAHNNHENNDHGKTDHHPAADEHAAPKAHAHDDHHTTKDDHHEKTEHAAEHHDAAKDEHKGGHDKHEAPHWAYTGVSGPEAWGKLQSDFNLCGQGKLQSPINLENPRWADISSVIEFNYHQSATEMTNNGHTIQVNFKPGNWIVVQGRKYELLQFHFHNPSEHQIEKKQFPMELHLVHKDEDGRLAVVGVLIESGKRNQNFSDMIARLPASKGATVGKFSINPNLLLPAKQDFFRYDGSLTTPPCSEGVAWHVLKTPIFMSDDQIDSFAAIMGKNARPVQPLFSRSSVFNEVGTAH